MLAAQTTFRPGSGRSAPAWARGPTADGQAAKPARRRAPLGPKLALSPPRRPSPSDLNPTAARARRANKTGDGRRSPNPRVHSLPPHLLSPRNGGDGHWPWWPGGAGRTAPPRLARRRARSPEGERAAVEPAVDGAMLSSPRAHDPGIPERQAGGSSVL